jgi:hypothetical protein
MRTPRFRILAVEPDPACGEILRQLIEGRANAEVVVVTSSEAAVGALASQLPDVVLLSALLPPIGEDQVMWQLRRTDPEHRVPVLMIPPAIDLVEPEATARRFGLFKRRSSPPRLGTYDPVALGTRIVEALQQSRLAWTTSTTRDYDLAAEGGSTAGIEVEPGTDAIVRQRTVASAAPDVLLFSGARGGRAHRLAAAELPWPCSLKTRDGTDVDLLNISNSGILIESSLKFAPQSTTEFHLLGPDSPLILPARFVRSSVSSVDTLGVRYQAAAVFSRKVEQFSSRRGATPTSAATPQALAQLLVRVTSEFNDSGTAADLRTTFEQGMRQLVPGCRIKLRDTPMVSIDGGDSIYFTVPTTLGAGAILQATFDPEYEPALDEFKLLRAAAAVAAVIVQYEEHASPARVSLRNAARSPTSRGRTAQ